VVPAPPATAPIPAPPATAPVSPVAPPPATASTPLPTAPPAAADAAPEAPRSAAPAAAVESNTSPPNLLAVQKTDAATAGKARVPLYKKWWFWTITGGIFTAVVLTTYAVTIPPPTPYYGNGNGGFNAIHFP
jgi:hypothetical protein